MYFLCVVFVGLLVGCMCLFAVVDFVCAVSCVGGWCPVGLIDVVCVH